MSEATYSGKASTSNGIEEDQEMAYRKSACKVTTFRIVYDQEDVDSDNSLMFRPEMAHQIFGSNETIFGYKTVSITINLLHNSCRCYLDLKMSGTVASSTVEPDNVGKLLDPFLPSKYTESREEFLNWVGQETHDNMFGEVLSTFPSSTPSLKFPEVSSKHIITKNDTTDAAFVEFHNRFQNYIIWFIDAANFIDMDDTQWLIYYLYEEFEHPKTKTIYRTPVGYCTVYKFYAYPSNIRARVSQIFILPSHQKRGLGTVLYQTVINSLKSIDEIIDVGVEEPTPVFQKIRDLEDCLVIDKQLRERNSNIFTMSLKSVFELGRQLKIGRKQMKRVYDILRLLKCNDLGVRQYKNCLESIKNRILDVNFKQAQPGKRFRKAFGEKISAETEWKADSENEYKNYVETLEPSVEYLKKKLSG